MATRCPITRLSSRCSFSAIVYLPMAAMEKRSSSIPDDILFFVFSFSPIHLYSSTNVIVSRTVMVLSCLLLRAAMSDLWCKLGNYTAVKRNGKVIKILSNVEIDRNASRTIPRGNALSVSSLFLADESNLADNRHDSPSIRFRWLESRKHRRNDRESEIFCFL